LKIYHYLNNKSNKVDEWRALVVGALLNNFEKKLLSLIYVVIDGIIWKIMMREKFISEFNCLFEDNKIVGGIHNNNQ
jgi:hypothetical protein